VPRFISGGKKLDSLALRRGGELCAAVEFRSQH
jgi:hypothetical protein